MKKIILIFVGFWAIVFALLLIAVNNYHSDDSILEPVAVRFLPENPKVTMQDRPIPLGYKSGDFGRNSRGDVVFKSRTPVELTVQFDGQPAETYRIFPPGWFDDGGLFVIRKGEEPINKNGAGRIERVQN